MPAQGLTVDVVYNVPEQLELRQQVFFELLTGKPHRLEPEVASEFRKLIAKAFFADETYVAQDHGEPENADQRAGRLIMPLSMPGSAKVCRSATRKCVAPIALRMRTKPINSIPHTAGML